MTSYPQISSTAFNEYRKLKRELEQLKKREEEIKSRIDLLWYKLIPKEQEKIYREPRNRRKQTQKS